MNGDGPGAWHLDRKVPITLIVTIVIQTMVVTWGAGVLWTRVDMLERQAAVVTPLSERIAKLEAKTDTVTQGIVEITNLIRRHFP